MKRLGLALAFLAALSISAFAQIGGLSFPGPGPIHVSGGGAVVALVDTGTASQSGSSVTTLTATPLTITGSLSNSLIACITYFQNSGTTGVTATWNGVSMTQVSGATVTAGSGCSPNCGMLFWFVLANPTSGSQNLVVNWTTAGRTVVDCWSFSGVNQSTPTQNGTSSTNGGTASAAGSVTVTSATNDMAIGSFVAGDGVAALTTVTPGGETQLYLTTTLGAFSNGANAKAGAATVALTSTFSGSTHWGAAGFDIIHN